MLKTRLIPSIITKNELVVQSFNFKKYLPIGNVKTAIEFFVDWDVDEILIIDIDASREEREPNFELVKWAASECFVPLTVGGGIKTLLHVQQLLQAGADKVCINSVTRENTLFIENAAKTFGDQCITVSLDIVKTEGEYRLYDHLSGQAVECDLLEHLRMLENSGAGEVLLNSVERDGSRMGFDLELLNFISSKFTIPVIALGGVGRFEHLAEAVIEGGCQAVSAANIFQHMEHSTIAAKSQMLKAGLNVRLSSEVKYEDFALDCLGRPF